MTSNSCFVYITLPGETMLITAGKLLIEESVGKFVYGKSYLTRPDAVAIDPVELKLTDKVYETAKMSGVFGAIRDASPDHWGRTIIQKRLGRINVSEMEYLLKSPDDRIGALGFGLIKTPSTLLHEFNKALDLEKLQNITDKIIASDYEQQELIQVEELLLLGTSMGGARPKATISDNNHLWLAKFNTDKDLWNYASVEHAMLKLASLCGLNVAQSRKESIGNKDVLLVKRFDRDGLLRHRMFRYRL